MHKQLEEDWRFEITVIRGDAKLCRLGLESGDLFTCGYECPAGFCPKTMPVLYTLCEIRLPLKLTFPARMAVYSFILRPYICRCCPEQAAS